jgi:hypothetical protein
MRLSLVLLILVYPNSIRTMEFHPWRHMETPMDWVGKYESGPSSCSAHNILSVLHREA